MQCEDRFFSNRVASGPLIENKLHEWILPVMRGIVQIYMIVLQKQPFEFILISRRSRYRTGTRYKTRGVDLKGHVANYVETEEIVGINGHWMSFVQIRGSIPLVWEQTGRKYTPVPKISPDADMNLKCLTSHFKSQLSLYQRQVVVNLLDQKGVEQELGSMYEEYCKKFIAANEDMTFVNFDFHEKCKTSYDNVAELIRTINNELERMGLFHKDPNGKVVTSQSGIVRTNCLDCLDRTNLVQTFIGRASMIRMLTAFGVQWEEKESTILERVFKDAWATNGDSVSLQYAGTSALKGDFTRTGKRQTKGVMKDGVNSISRYYINIFKDTLRQVSIDLFYGNTGFNQTKDLEDDILAQRGLWNKAQYQAIEECTAYLEESDNLLSDDEVITHAWIIISINEMDVEQERVLVLTTKALFRFKFNFNTTKNPITRYRRLELNDITSCQFGPFSNKPTQFGFSMNFASLQNKTQSAHIYCVLDYSKEGCRKTLEAIVTAAKEFRPNLDTDEKTITRTKTVRGAVLNKFKLGMFNGRKASKEKTMPAPNAAPSVTARTDSLGSSPETNSSGLEPIDDDDDDIIVDDPQRQKGVDYGSDNEF